MEEFLGGEILVRESVAEKLAKANTQLKKMVPNFSLYVCYGYRSPDVQRLYFTREKERLARKYPRLPADLLTELVHKKVAVPEVAGHPTGGAIDVTLYDEKLKQFVDTGGEIADFSDSRIITFSNGLTGEQISNRVLLCFSLMSENFAPFFGEWWHFSYGDIEWAFFYNKKQSLYPQEQII